MPPLGAIRAREWRRCCRLWRGYLSDRPAAAHAEPCSGLVLKATSWAGNRQSRAALGAKAPRCCVFGRAGWAAHLEPWPLETIGFEHISGLIAEEANISSSRVLTSPRCRRVLPTRRASEKGRTDTAGTTALERQKSKDLHTAVEISEGDPNQIGPDELFHGW